MIEAQFEYRCRRCNTLYRNPCCSVEMARMLLHTAPALTTDKAVRLFAVHTCGDGGEGLADLQGYRIHGKESE